MPDNDTIRKRIGGRISDARGTVSRRDIATQLDVSVQAISQWERGDAMPSPATQIALARVLGVSWSDLFNLDDEVA